MIIDPTINLLLLLIATFLLCPIVSSSVPRLFEDKNQFTLDANWLQDSSTIDTYLPKYQKFLKRDGSLHLTLLFSYCTDPQYILRNFFNRELTLHSLHLNLDTCKIGDEGVNLILGSLNKKSLQRLHLIISSAVSPQIGAILGKHISQMELRSLEVGLMMGGLGDKGLSDMFLYPLPGNIQLLSLDLTSNKLEEKAFNNFTFYLANIPSQSLKSIELLVRGNTITANGTFAIARALKRFNNLESFRLDAYLNHLKTQGVRPIALLLQHLPRLTLLDLNFDLNYIETEGGKLLGRALGTFTGLEILSLGLNTKNFGYNGFHHVANGIMNLAGLKSLDLRCGVNRIGAKGAKLLQQILMKLPQLRYLKLQFPENMMYDEGVRDVSEAILSLQHLQTVNLNFNFNDLKLNAMEKILSSLRSRGVRRVSAAFSNNPLTDVEIKQALPVIKDTLANCQQFQLQLLYSKVSEQLKRQLEVLFEENRHCSSILHINSEEEVNRIQAEIEKAEQDDKNSEEL